MKNKRFITICLILILITTFSLIITHILKTNDDKNNLTFDTLKDKSFVHITKDESGESKETISFTNTEAKKAILIKSNNDSIDDIKSEATYVYSIKDDEIHLKISNITVIYK